jgi:hypothetical protein
MFRTENVVEHTVERQLVQSPLRDGKAASATHRQLRLIVSLRACIAVVPVTYDLVEGGREGVALARLFA